MERVSTSRPFARHTGHTAPRSVQTGLALPMRVPRSARWCSGPVFVRVPPCFLFHGSKGPWSGSKGPPSDMFGSDPTACLATCAGSAAHRRVLWISRRGATSPTKRSDVCQDVTRYTPCSHGSGHKYLGPFQARLSISMIVAGSVTGRVKKALSLFLRCRPTTLVMGYAHNRHHPHFPPWCPSAPPGPIGSLYFWTSGGDVMGSVLLD